MHTVCSIFHQEIFSGFLKLGRIDFSCSSLTTQVFHGGDGTVACRSCPGPTSRQQWSQGWTKRCPRPGLRQDPPGVASAGHWAHHGHTSPRASSTISPESQSLICCLSFPTCEVDKVMPWGRVFIFSPTNTRTLQEREGSKGCWVLPVPTLQASPPPFWGELILSLLPCRYHL